MEHELVCPSWEQRQLSTQCCIIFCSKSSTSNICLPIPEPAAVSHAHWEEAAPHTDIHQHRKTAGTPAV